MHPGAMMSTDIVLMRLGFQIIITIMSGLAARGAWLNFRQCRSPFPQYVSYSLTCLMVKTAFMASVSIWQVASGAATPPSFVPMIDHLGKLVWSILLVNAFILCVPAATFLNRYFLLGNIILMVLVSTMIWLFWLEFLYAASPGRGTFNHFWGNPFYETWIALVLLLGIVTVGKSAIVPKPLFQLAFIVLLTGELIHIYDLMTGPHGASWNRIADRLLLVSYCGIMMSLFARKSAVEVASPQSLNRIGCPMEMPVAKGRR